MAARSVHVYFKNLTDETLVLEGERLNHGIYTDPWHPPKIIAPGAIGQWQSESDGWFRGTAGWASYRIPTGDRFEFAQLDFGNPYIGGNESNISIVEDFSGQKSKLFEGANTINGDPPPNWVKMTEGDVEAWIDAVLFPPYIFANASSADDANATFAIRRKPVVSSPLLGPQSDAPRSSQVNTALKAAEWSGLWGGDGVSATLTSLVGHNMNAQILDTTVDPELHVQENFTLGGHAWTMNSLVVGIQNEFGTARNANNGAVLAITSAAAQSISMLREKVPADAVSTVQTAVGAALEARGARISESKLLSISKTTVALATIPRTSVILSHGISLTLYDDFQDGHKTGSRLLYERTSTARGKRLASHWLSFHPILH